jgi:hypothetical protein
MADYIYLNKSYQRTTIFTMKEASVMPANIQLYKKYFPMQHISTYIHQEYQLILIIGLLSLVYGYQSYLLLCREDSMLL